MVKKAFFAIQLWGRDVLNTFKIIEELGFDAAYYGDGPFDWLLDCFSVLAYASAITNKLRLGPAVTYLEGSYRHPIAVMKALFTLAKISHERIDARFGFIREEAKEYWLKYGIKIKNLKDRIRNFERYISLIKELRDKGYAKIEEEGYVFEISHFQPIARFPICISAMGKRTIPIALKHADILELSYIDPISIDRIIQEYKDQIGKIELSLELDVIIAKDKNTFRKKYLEYRRMRRTEKEKTFIDSAIKGTPEKCIDKIQAYLDVGIKRFTLAFNEFPNMDGIKIFSEEVLPSF